MFRRPQYIALITVVLLALILFELPSGTVSKFKLAISGFFVPLFGLSGSAQRAVDKAGDTALPRGELIRRNEQLEQENQRLKILVKRTEAIEQENQQLRDLIGWQRRTRWNLKLASVISRDPANWWRTVLIDLGSRDGVQTNYPVVTVDGLVGRISAVGTTRSQVLLLGDENLRVAAVIADTMTSASGREMGVISANSSSANPFENNMVTLSYLSGNSAVRPGQNVFTSGDGGVFPGGIPIGRVVDTRSIDYGLSTEARVTLFTKMNTLDKVWVLFPQGPVPSAQNLVPPVNPPPTIQRPATRTR